ncbi:V/A-type H+-transporting ATPase subunit E [Methanocalculus alkaliphilus]|uniref:V-type ATP synthase subunit E n=1 Tax=Methanocalculus alkaliphilus TaxID=768730 RepID=UPI00209C917E|nr:V-type ATP synthase subunit E [Methanocalculus alkaliphilus]MCP1714645.1 V/A-type H+-transporting ATPase subunit E [Methanocalculus alkaliphilus]
MYEHLIETVELSAEEKIREIQQAAEGLVERIREEAGREGEKIRDQHLASAQRAIAMERSAILTAREKNKLDILRTRDEIFHTAFLEAERELETIREDPRYRSFLEKAINGLTGEMEGSFTLHIDERDLDLCEDIVASHGLDISIIPDITCMGGIIARSSDGSLTVQNTLESRLQRSKEALRSEVFRILNGG